MNSCKPIRLNVSAANFMTLTEKFPTALSASEFLKCSCTGIQGLENKLYTNCHLRCAVESCCNDTFDRSGRYGNGCQKYLCVTFAESNKCETLKNKEGIVLQI